MKNMKKYLLTLIAVLTFVFALQVSAGAANVYFKGCTDTSITVGWDKPALSSGRTFQYYQLETESGAVIARLSNINTLNYTIEGLKKGIHDTIWVSYFYKTNYGGPYESYMGYTDACTTPVDTGLKDLYTGSKKTELHVSGNLPDGATGLQFEFKDLSSGKVTKSEKDYSAYATKTIAVNSGYTVRVRAYAVCSTDKTKKVYGKWSKQYIFAVPTFTGKASSGSAGFKITLKKGKKIKNYTVYTSSKRDSGFKKAATVKVTGKTKTVRITKAGGKKIPARKTCYVKVVPNVIYGGTAKASIMYGLGSVYVYK